MKFQLYLDDSLIVRSVYPTHDGEFPDPRLAQSEPIRLEAGRAYRLRVEAQESYGEAQLQLLWSPPHETLEAEAVEVGAAGGRCRDVRSASPRVSRARRCRCRSTASAAAIAQRSTFPRRSSAAGAGRRARQADGARAAQRKRRRGELGAGPTCRRSSRRGIPGKRRVRAIADVLFGDYNPARTSAVTFYKSVERSAGVRRLSAWPAGRTASSMARRSIRSATA